MRRPASSKLLGILFVVCGSLWGQQTLPVPVPVFSAQTSSVYQVSSAVSGGAVTAISVVLPSTQRHWTLAVTCAGGNWNATSWTPTFTDTLSNTWTIPTGSPHNQGNTLMVITAYAVNQSSGADTVTLTLTGANSAASAMGCIAWQLPGMRFRTSSATTLSGGNNAGSTSPTDSGSSNEAQPGFVRTCVIAAAGSTFTPGTGTNFTPDILNLAPAGGNLANLNGMSYVSSGIQGATCNGTLGGSNAWVVESEGYVLLPIEVEAVISGTPNVNVSNTPTVTANAGTNLNTSALALDTSVNGVLLAQTSTTSGQTGPLVQGAVTTSAPSYTTAKTSPLSLNTSGGLRVDGSGVTQPVAGAAASGASKAGNPVQIGFVFNTTQPTVTTGQAVEAQGTARGAQIVATGVDIFNVTVNAALPAGSALIGETNPMATATTTDSALTSYTAAAASTNSTSVKGSAGNVYGYTLLNTTSTIYYLRMYNSSSAPTCSSATGFVESIPIPHNSGNGAGIELPTFVPQGFTTGIGYCITGGAGSTDNTNAAVGVFVRILYK